MEYITLGWANSPTHPYYYRAPGTPFHQIRAFSTKLEHAFWKKKTFDNALPLVFAPPTL
jgi:hypothetical protein